ncbi:DNA polymerase/3'-5' exonuclease PolX [Abyssisolibacter fermentans]|uniref:DNA polymerase/3'-5' exonuclease PolX n=1 Tax=Abyssisolibacter fermentans TaxID=1766203 RepID=UPI00082B2D61|nr:DNA polymerase/3'-5' exonuclease PolX [Abyssisolibacter fermentans]
MTKRDIIRTLNHIGLLLEIKGESFFKSKAYYDAARKIELMQEDIFELVKEGKLGHIKGFGKALTEKIGELVNTGKLKYYEDLQSSIPEGLIQMLKIPGIGAKKIKILYDKLGISTIQELKQACLEDKLLIITGFSKKGQEKILEGIIVIEKYADKFHFPVGDIIAQEIIKSFEDVSYIKRYAVAGSLRRKKEIIKDIDILVSSDEPDKVMDIFTSHYYVVEVTSKGNTKSSVILQNGLRADLRVVTDKQYPYALHHFTGSKEHNTALRHLAKQKGLKINEYGIFSDEKLIECKDENDIFKVFGMDFIQPEIRENNGELQAAIEGKLPKLIESKDIKGLVHVHTNYSDGSATIKDLARECIKRGYKYLGITDHSKSAIYAGGLKKDDIIKQHNEIDQLNKKYLSFQILKGTEADILADGSIDYSDEVLKTFDFVIASIHSSFKMDEKKMTKRIIKAIENKYVKILGHPTGRLLLSREPYNINIDEIVKACVKNNVIIEINSNPYRLDLDWRYIKAAKEKGAKFVISPDAHSIKDLDYVRYGINVARKGWLEKSDVANASEDLSLYFK